MSSRVIKFRFWDLTNSKWSNGLGIYCDGSIGDFTECFHNSAGEQGEYYVAQQFTGLHDKDGKEIYEGDIVSLVYRDLSQDRIKQFAVTWNDYRGGFDSNPPFEIYDISNYQIVGNIFENPNALK